MEFYEDRRLELCNLETDRGETQNVAKERHDVRQTLHAQLTRWLDTNDAPMPRRRLEDP